MLDWKELEESCLKCSACELCQRRTNVVFGVGNRNADIVFVGEGPGEQEDLLGEPFVGPAGKLLDDMLSIIDLDRTKVYICNVVKCRPPGNRDPKDEEQAACNDYLRNQIALLNPKMIVCLGRIAAKKMIADNFRITRDHGTWQQIDGIWITAIYHPSALLRDMSKRPETFRDLLSIREAARNLGISI